MEHLVPECLCKYLVTVPTPAEIPWVPRYVAACQRQNLEQTLMVQPPPLATPAITDLDGAAPSPSDPSRH